VQDIKPTLGHYWRFCELAYADQDTIAASGGRLISVGPIHAAYFPDKLIVAFRGTDSWQNWEANFKTDLIEFDDTGRRAHRGFLEEYYKIHPRLVDVVSEDLSVITGHSLGGALATICSLHFPNALTVTYGAPAVGDRYFVDSLENHYRCVYANDIVPKLPPSPEYRQSQDCYVIHRSGRVTYGWPWTKSIYILRS